MTDAASHYDLPQVYTPEELQILDKGKALVASFDSLKHEKLKTGTSLVKGEVSVGGDSVSARAAALIRAPVEHVVAFHSSPHKCISPSSLPPPTPYNATGTSSSSSG